MVPFSGLTSHSLTLSSDVTRLSAPSQHGGVRLDMPEVPDRESGRRQVLRWPRVSMGDADPKEVPVKVSNAVTPSPDQIRAFLASDLSGQVCMVNLLKFKQHAEYADGRESNLSGKEAYGL